ncbi:mediator of RNA polymerase II transcription subunit 13 [Lambiella insularis]|nr:mediator of RNA polymerase II transcription subunit 13 [Lambiella insularis]
MDFPKNALTNVHKIGGVLFIQWSVYGPEGPEIPATDHVPQRTQRQIDDLALTEHELQGTGNHVLRDIVHGVLWVFDLSGPIAKKEPRGDDHHGRVSTLAQRHGLKRLLFGSIRASDLAGTPKADQQLPLSISHKLPALPRPSSTDSSGEKYEVKGLSLSQDNASICTKILSAISASVLFFLTKSNRYIPLSPNLFLVPEPSEEVSAVYSEEKLECPTVYMALRIEVQWLSCGTLLVYSYFDDTMSWHRQFGYSSQSLAWQPVELILAPFGIVGRAIQTEPTRKTSFVKDTENVSPDKSYIQHALKVSVSILLEQHGFQLTEHCQWIRLNVTAPSHEMPSLQAGVTTEELIWPAHLCFYKDVGTQYTGHEDAWLWPGLRKNAVDPLKAAEAWYLNTDTREKQIEQRRREIEAELHAQVHTAPSDEDDFTSSLFQTINRRFETQGMNSIYPTPPDGFQSHISGQPSDHESYRRPFIQGDVEMLDPGRTADEHNGNIHATSDSAPGVTLNLETYGHAEDDDLFGDMDSAMYTAKGITEDVFDFFDEPEDVGHAHELLLKAEPTDHSVSPTGRMTIESASAMKWHQEDAKTVQQALNQTDKEITPASEVVPSGKALNSIQEALPRLASGSLQSIPTATSLQSIKSETRDFFDPNIVRNITTKPSPAPLEQIYTNEISIFGAVTLTDAPQTLDQKYTDTGRFSTDGDSKREFDVDKVSHKREKSIPILAQLTMSGNDDLESDEDDESDGIVTPITMDVQSDHDNIAISTVNLSHISADAIPVDENSLPPSATTRTQFQDKGVGGYPASPSASLDSTDEIYCGNDETFITIAQILADQLLLYSSIDDQEDLMPDETQPSVRAGLFFEDPLKSALADLFSHDEICTLEECASLSENPRTLAQLQKATARPVPRKQDSVLASSDATGSSSCTVELRAPHVRVMRGDASMDISSTALQFWEELGLSPFLGPKNITVFCVYPDSEMICRGSASFMRSLGTAYQSFRLGSYTCGNETVIDWPHGLVPVSLNRNSMEDAAMEIDKVCRSLGESLSHLASARQTIIVYIVNPFCAPSSLPRLCECFLKCFEKYASAASTVAQENPSDLVLKIIPMGLVASTTTVAIPSPSQYVRLAKDIYDRCPMESTLGDLSPYASASFVQLAENIPRSLSLRLTTDPTTRLSVDHETLHIGYSWRSGSQWLCSSLTDNLGKLRWNASYCFGDTSSNLWPTLLHIIHEIWSGVVDIVGRSSHKYTVYVVKDEPLEQKEIEAWLRVSTLPENPPVTLVVLCAEESPPIYYSMCALPSSVPEDAAFYTTPESTPLPNAATPDNQASPGFANGAINTPRIYESTDAESGARLVEVTDQSWGIVFSRPIHSHGYGMNENHSLSSGYLLKRAGGRDENGWVMMGVHVVHAGKWTESSMKDLLAMYGSLGTLARARGVEDSVTGILPWHIAVASKSRKSLTLMMSYGDR